MCQYFHYSRSAYYRSLHALEQEALSACLILNMVRGERRVQPRLGGRKLYHILGSDIHRIAPHFGRDQFFALLREHDLLVERKHPYHRTTLSCHHFHRFGNLIRDLCTVRPNQVWASDITCLRTGKGFVDLSSVTDMYFRKIVGWSVSDSVKHKGLC